jgi:DNA-binding HxlR family transcriptional regulator
MSDRTSTHEVCAQFHKAVELIGGRWTGAIIQLLMKGPIRYCRIREAVPEISDRMLSERLRELEEQGIVERLVVPDTPVRVEYRLTSKGKALEPAFTAIGKWAHRYLELEPPARPAPKTAGKDRTSARR